jgi:hypothetical protein
VVVEQAALRAKGKAEDAVTLESFAALALQLRHRLRGCGANLDGADELRFVVGVDAAGCFGIEAAEQAPERVRLATVAKALAESFIAGRAVEEAFEHSSEVEASAAADDGKVSAGSDLMGCAARQASVLACGEIGVRGNYVDQVVRHTGAFIAGGLGGTDLEFAINGYGVATDDLSAKALGQRESQR